MKVATRNVNSRKVRLPRVREFLNEHAPDIVCMQETKSDVAPCLIGELADAGYHAVHHSGGRCAGVAIVARRELELADPIAGLPAELRDDDARWVEATVGGLRVASVYWVVQKRLTGNAPPVGEWGCLSPSLEVAMRPTEVFVRDLTLD